MRYLSACKPKKIGKISAPFISFQAKTHLERTCAKPKVPIFDTGQAACDEKAHEAVECQGQTRIATMKKKAAPCEEQLACPEAAAVAVAVKGLGRWTMVFQSQIYPLPQRTR